LGPADPHAPLREKAPNRQEEIPARCLKIPPEDNAFYSNKADKNKKKF
jgi:hypothetical protein